MVTNFFYTHKISNIFGFFKFQGLIYEIDIQKIFVSRSNLRQNVKIQKFLFLHYRIITYILN